jgi:hypothetical protein
VICCPSCQATNVQAYAVIFAAQTITTHGVAIGSTWGGGSTVAGMGAVHQSALAQSCAPPTKRGRWWMWLLFGGTGPIGWIAGALFYGVYCHGFNRSTYPQLVRDWQHSWYCSTCGHRFISE